LEDSAIKKRILTVSIITLIGVIIFTCLISPALYGEPLNELFANVPSFFLSQNIRNQAKQTKAVIRSRYVEVKFDSLAGKGLPQGVDSIILNIFDDVSFSSIKDRLERRSEKSYTWFGHTEGREYSHAILTVESNAMAGSITFEKKTYQIQELGDGIHAIYEIDPSVFPEDAPPIVPPEEIPDVSADVPPTPNADDGSTIDVMVVYTQDVANASPSIALDIQLAIDQTNQSYANSNINQRVRLVHTEQVIYSETSDFPTALERLQDPSDGYMDEVHSLRNTYDADLSMLIVENLTDNFCGLGYTMNASWLSSAFEEFAFSVVRLDCLTLYAPAHEMGHNMGALHDRYVSEEDDIGAYDYSHGYVYKPDRWRTIMAYNAECQDSGYYCPRTPYWSNPYVNYNGIPTGISEYEIDSADNAETLNNTAYIVANFRESALSTTTTITTTTSPNSTTTSPSTTTSLLTSTTSIGSSQPCTAALIYGEHSEETELLRYIRDNVLNKSQEGRELIKLYYQWNPVIVRAMEDDDEFKEEVKEMIEGVLPLVRKTVK
jgi:hypothetical protein